MKLRFVWLLEPETEITILSYAYETIPIGIFQLI